ncbi:hypothetical protein [Alteromonas gracilis]|uniref:hypothetical protein n=1 Tax=Alteromonas gracilis TaxID=1479524 RepID=UPI0037363223
MRKTSYRYHFTSPFYLMLACMMASVSDIDSQHALIQGASLVSLAGAGALKTDILLKGDCIGRINPNIRLPEGA